MAKDISLKLEIDSKTGQAQIKKVTKDIKNFGRVGKNAAKKLSTSFTNATAKLKLFAIGITASVAAMGYLAKKSLDSADKIAKLGDSLGISTKTLQEYTYAAGLSGVSQDTLNSSMTAFTKRLGEARAGSGALTTYLKKANPVLLEQLKNTNNVSDGLNIFMTALGNVKNSTDRAALAAAAFSRAGVGMTVMVKDGAGGFKLMTKEANDLGLVLNRDLLANAEKLNDSMSKVSQIISMIFTKAVLKLAPEIEKVVDHFKNWYLYNKDIIDLEMDIYVERITKGFKSFAKVLGFVEEHLKVITYTIGILVGIRLLSWIAPIIAGFIKWVGGAAMLAWEIKSLNAFFLVGHGAILGWFKSLGFASAAAGTFATAVIAIGAAFAGWGIAKWLERFECIRKASDYTANLLAFMWKYHLTNIKLTFYETIDKIKEKWADLKNWFIKTFPKMAKFMGMEKIVFETSAQVAKLKEKLKDAKEEYEMFVRAIEKRYAKPHVLETIVVTGKRLKTEPGAEPPPPKTEAEKKLAEDRLTWIKANIDTINKLTLSAKDYELKILKDTYNANKKMYGTSIIAYKTYQLEKTAIIKAASQADLDLVLEAEQRKLDIKAQFDEQYFEMGASKFELERTQLELWRDTQLQIWGETEAEKNRINELYASKAKQITKAETNERLSFYQNMAGGMASIMKQVSAFGAKSSKKAFRIYQGFAIVDAIISANLAAAKVLGQTGIFGIPLSAMVYAQAMGNVALIAAQKPPSYDQGGISNARGIYQTGDIAEAHIPIPSGGKIPVEVEDKAQRPIVNIILKNPIFQDLATQQQTMMQIAEIVTREIAPNVIVNDYDNDGITRQMVRGRA